jgi:hypothetical protein
MRRLAAQVLWTLGALLFVAGLGFFTASAMLWTEDCPDG